MKCLTPSGAPRWITWAVLLGVPILLFLSWPVVRFDEGQAFANLFDFLKRFFVVPDSAYLPKLFERLWETLLIALAATVWAVLLSFPPAFFAARNITPHPALGGVIRVVAAVLRALPDLLLALLLASALGLGPVPGVIALIVASAGFLIKNYADALEVVDRRPIEGVVATGAGWLSVRTIGVLPQAAPDVLGLSLYQLDVNVRSSAILGAVGAGGIGYDLTQAIRLFQFDRLGAIMLGAYFMVTIIDRASDAIRRRLA